MVWKCTIFCFDVSYSSLDKNKNRCLCGNLTFPNLMHHHSLESTQPMAFWFAGPDVASCWKVCDFCMGMCSCYNIEQSVFCKFRSLLSTPGRRKLGELWQRHIVHTSHFSVGYTQEQTYRMNGPLSVLPTWSITNHAAVNE